MEKRNNSGIYTITNLINNKLIVGYASNFRTRKTEHFGMLRRNEHKNQHLQRAFNEYGEQNFKFEILEECDKQFLASQEHYWATILNSHNNNFGYNILPTHPNNKRSVSEETRQKLSIAGQGRKHSEETKRKISIGQKNRKYIKGAENPCFGRKMSEDQKEKLRISAKNRKISMKKGKPVIMICPKSNKELENFISIKLACIFLGKDQSKGSGIIKVCKGKTSHNTAFGYKWKYA